MPNEIIKTFKGWPKFKERFISYIPKDCFLLENKDICWEWQGPKHDRGYGWIFWASKDKYSAHRVSYMIFKGHVPKDQIVRHTCDNPCCVNPNHLILGNHADNANDMITRNRGGGQKLNSEAVKVIKWMLKYKPKHGLAAKLAQLHKVHITTISDIKLGHSWGHIKV